MKLNRTHLVKIIMTAILIALNVVLERFMAFQIESNHYTVSVITVAFAAVFLGTPYAVTVAALGDILGALIAPTGPYFPGFTLTNVLAALCIALFLRKKVNLLNTSASIVINKIFCTLILNSIWVSVLYKGGIDAFPAYFVTRIPQAIIMAVIEIVIITVLFDDKSHIRKLLNRVVGKSI